MNQPNPKARVTLRDIAERLNISHTTVSHALRDTPRFSKELRMLVKRTAEEMGYRPDPMLSALAHYRRGKKNIPIAAELAWINQWPDPKQLRSFHEFDLYWKGALEEAERNGFRLEEFTINERMSPTRVEKILLTRNIRGILIPPHGGITLNWGDLRWEHFCIVRLGHSISTPRAHLVTSDQLTDGIIAVENIWKRGYRRIGLAISLKVQTRFSAGYFFSQMEWPPELRIPVLAVPEKGSEKDLQQIRSWLKQHKPDAILTDLTAMPEWLAQFGYNVPGDVGLAILSVLEGGVDAGIDQNSEEIGKAAIQLLISLINHNERGIPEICRELLVEGRWVDGSTLPPK
jgi:LacI family transcriptional regulator